MIDLHSHVLPGLDDGARSYEDAVALAREAAATGVTVIAATPHVRDDYPTEPEAMELGVVELRRALAREQVDVEIVCGGEIALDRLPSLDDEELRRFSYAQGGRYVLLEFPYSGWPHRLETSLASVAAAGMTPILAHPERNAAVQARPAALGPLVAAGALVQVTALSLTGAVGRSARAAARELLERGLAHVLASDAHGPHIPRSGLAAAAAEIGDPGLVRYLTVETPRAILDGARVEPPAPLAQRRFRLSRRGKR